MQRPDVITFRAYIMKLPFIENIFSALFLMHLKEIWTITQIMGLGSYTALHLRTSTDITLKNTCCLQIDNSYNPHHRAPNSILNLLTFTISTLSQLYPIYIYLQESSHILSWIYPPPPKKKCVQAHRLYYLVSVQLLRGSTAYFQVFLYSQVISLRQCI